jgi:hypothetical protein
MRGWLPPGLVHRLNRKRKMIRCAFLHESGLLRADPRRLEIALFSRAKPAYWDRL